MKSIRVLIAAVLLVWTPLSGAVAAAVGANLSHHHCDDPWHGHDVDHAVSAAAGDDHGPVTTDPFSCEDCHIAMAALPAGGIVLEPGLSRIPSSDTAALAQHVVVIALFRPPRA